MLILKIMKFVHKKLFQIQAAERKRPRDERDLVNRLKPFARLHTAQEHETFVDGLVYEMTLRKRINELQEYRRMGLTTFAEAELYEKDKVARATFRPMPGRESLLLSNNRSGRESKRPSLGGDETILPKPSTSKKHNTLSLTQSQGFHLLTNSEQRLCSQLRMLPRPYLVVKEAIVREWTRRNGRLRKDQLPELTGALEPSKVEKIYEHLLKTGILYNNNSLP